MSAHQSDSPETVERIMTAFAEQTGLSADRPPRRYLWTDAFAVCNFLELHRTSGGSTEYLTLALRLIAQVHETLGRHRLDDERAGWLSALDEAEAERHPTIGGLRIGKPLPERLRHEPYDERVEWDRDGQYYHYLTKWMHALQRTAQVTRDARYHQWAVELAKSTHAAFRRCDETGRVLGLSWKMSIDLKRPLVDAMGQHDPLDGLITLETLQRNRVDDRQHPGAPDLRTEIAELQQMCRGTRWATGDLLGAGGLLTDAYRVAQLVILRQDHLANLLSTLLAAATSSLHVVSQQQPWTQPADYRLAFRELGLGIGLRAVGPLIELLQKTDLSSDQSTEWRRAASRLERFVPLAETLAQFWLDPATQQTQSWTAHADINSVMLAACLAPTTYLSVG